MPPMKRKRTWSNSRPAKKKARVYTPKNRYSYARPAATKEVKGVDTNLYDAAAVTNLAASNTSAFCLNLVQQGAGSWNRVGRKIYNKSIQLKGEIGLTYLPDTITGIVNLPLLRMVIVWDSQPSGGALPNFSDIFGITGQTGTETFNVYDPPRYDTMSRYTVLKDEFIDPKNTIVPYSGGDDHRVNVSYPINTYMKLGNRETVFQASNNPSTVADIATGSLLIYFRSTVGATAEAFYILPANFNARLRYTD